ncbi:MAG TPA: serine hydrolase domain-containing protein [Candidatus Dormibacteraeota bacterium]|nr:serine hydrolase domain-containing protein [Candidatus Dormibacteraeota bacterium]
MIQAPVGGSVETGFEAVQEAFTANFERYSEVGAACCVYLHGRRVVDLWGGVTTPGGSEPYTADTLQMVWSTTKGVVSIAAHMLAQEGKLDFDAPVTDYWPEFVAQGKGGIPVRWLFCHKSGLAAVDRPLGLDDVIAWNPCVEALEAQRPYWEPGTAHGYHTWTFGWLAGEIIRRVTGVSVGKFVAERIAKPLQAEFWIGLPESLNARVAPVLPPIPPAPGTPPDPHAARIADPSSLAHKSWANPAIPPAAFNEYPFRAAEVPAGNGIGTARALSRLYAACLGPVDGVRLLEAETLEKATVIQARGEDLVQGYETHFGTGFQLTFPFRPMAGPGSFGHYGSGGSVGFAHQELGISFGYVMNQMRPVYGSDPRTSGIVQALLNCLR